LPDAAADALPPDRALRQVLELSHELHQVARLRGTEQQVHVVGHDAVRVDQHAGPAGMLLQHLDRRGRRGRVGEAGAAPLDRDGDGADGARLGVGLRLKADALPGPAGSARHDQAGYYIGGDKPPRYGATGQGTTRAGDTPPRYGATGQGATRAGDTPARYGAAGQGLRGRGTRPRATDQGGAARHLDGHLANTAPA